MKESHHKAHLCLTRRGFLVLFFFVFYLSQPAQAELNWKVREIVKDQSSATYLTDNQGNRYKKVSVPNIRTIWRIFHDVSSKAELTADLIIVRGNAPNAFANSIGSNIIGINFGMLDLVGEDVNIWANLLGHEFAHLKLSHSLAGIKRGIPLAILGELIERKVEKRQVKELLGFTTQAIDSHYSQEQESDSDYLGAIWALEAGFSPWGAVELHKRLLSLTGTDNYPDFLKSHPSSEKRIKRLSKLARRLESK